MRPLLQWLGESTRHRIGRRIAIFILLFSSVVTLFSTVFQLGLEYRRDIRDIETQLDQIRDSYSESLASSLWTASQKDLELQLKGILRLPDIQYIEVLSEQGQPVVKVGQPNLEHIIGRAFPLYYTHRKHQVFIGTVNTVASLEGVYRRLRDKVIVILISQTIKTFLVSLFILFLFQILVGRHLNKVAAYSDRMSAEQMGTRLALDRRATTATNGDELDQVVQAINDMQQRLKQSLSALREANETKEDQVRERTAQLERANKELEAFSYSVSHDLRSPLRGIDGWSLALLEDFGGQLDATGRKYLDRIRSETQRMGHLIDDMLRFSRYSRTEMSKRPVDLGKTADSIAARIRHAHPERQFDFVIHPGMLVQGDPGLLEVVLTNLFENACKFAGMRDVVRIEFGQVEIVAPGTTEPQAAFFIRDNGVGFDMDNAQKLFGVFQRMHKTSEFPGTGIGLATVHRIVHRHGGHIWAQSHVNQGACFYFTLQEAS